MYGIIWNREVNQKGELTKVFKVENMSLQKQRFGMCEIITVRYGTNYSFLHLNHRLKMCLGRTEGRDVLGGFNHFILKSHYEI